MAVVAENIQYGIPFYFYLIFLLPILSIVFFILALLFSIALSIKYLMKAYFESKRWKAVTDDARSGSFMRPGST